MGIEKRGKSTWRVTVYDPRVGRKVSVGTRKLLKGSDPDLHAQALFNQKTAEFSKGSPKKGMTVDQYAERWLNFKHGPGTKRPARSSYDHNRVMLRPFLADFGDRELRSVTRVEALDWSLPRGANARVVSAMYSDAFDEELVEGNPFANRGQALGQGRKHIVPLTEAEVDKLGDIALEVWGPETYGPICRAWILFSAWVGSRPGETFAVRWEDLHLDEGLVTVRRVKGRKQTEDIVLPDKARDAILAMPGERTGLVFRSLRGRSMAVGKETGYYWRPVRSGFVSWLAQTNPARLRELQAVKGSTDLYALRHVCASIMVDRGANEFQVAGQLGNSPDVCRKTYIHAYAQRVNERNRVFLNAPAVVDLTEERKQRRGEAG